MAVNNGVHDLAGTNLPSDGPLVTDRASGSPRRLDRLLARGGSEGAGLPVPPRWVCLRIYWRSAGLRQSAYRLTEAMMSSGGSGDQAAWTGAARITVALKTAPARRDDDGIVGLFEAEQRG